MKKASIYFVFLNVLIISAISFGQTYSGPLTGSVNSGVVVTTDNFLSMPIRNESQGQPRIIPLMEIDSKPVYYKGDKPAFDNYLYVEDENAHLQSRVGIGTSFELHGFNAHQIHGPTQYTPPDPAMAVGLNHVVTSVNQDISIWDKEGNLLKTIDGVQWFSQVAPAPEVSGDPQVIYDHYANRWTIVFMGINSATLQASNLICYSDDDNPLGTWYMYRLPTTTWGDYPHVGYDDQGIYISTNNYPLAGGTFLYATIRILNKSELYASNAGTLSYTDIWNISLPSSSTKVSTLQPAISYDPGNNAAYFAWNHFVSANFYAIYKITDPITNPILTGVTLPLSSSYFAPPPSNQLGGGTPLANLGRMTSVPIVRDGKLYAVHSIRNTQFASNSSIKYWVADVNTNTILELIEQGAQGFYYSFPAIIVDQDHNLAITYTRSADTEYIGAYYSTKLGTDPPGLSPSKVMMEGQSNYELSFGGGRWGDYFAAGLDPVNQYNIWLHSEYAAAQNSWGTWVTEIRMKPYAGASTYTAENPVAFDEVEVGSSPVTRTVTISNYGEDDLVINSVTSPIGPFTLLNNPFPLTLSTYDSLDLEIEFDPSTPAIYSELMAFDDNDPGFEGLTLNGQAYTINPAYIDLIYASTGIVENGKLLTVNRNSGAGSGLGLSNYEELKSLTIDPVTNVLYGISPGSSETELVKVNATDGDGFTQYSLDIGLMVGIAFDTSGTLYGATRAGGIYIIDLSDGSLSLVTTASIQLTAITFNPFTNQMWAVPRVVIGVKDKIYTIDLTTGDGTLVGQTGFGKLTNDMAFDENGILYGVIGGANEGGQLITINTTNGSGTLVGDIGFQNVVGLAYTITGDPNSAEDQTSETPPDDFSLAQNYPNPFNPSTSIEFSVPVNSDVTIKIFNLLGEVVTTLVNEEISTGHYSVVWNGNDDGGNQVTSGIYFYKMKANGTNGKEFQQIRKMVLLK